MKYLIKIDQVLETNVTRRQKFKEGRKKVLPFFVVMSCLGLGLGDVRQMAKLVSVSLTETKKKGGF